MTDNTQPLQTVQPDNTLPPIPPAPVLDPAPSDLDMKNGHTPRFNVIMPDPFAEVPFQLMDGTTALGTYASNIEALNAMFAAQVAAGEL